MHWLNFYRLTLKINGARGKRKSYVNLRNYNIILTLLKWENQLQSFVYFFPSFSHRPNDVKITFQWRKITREKIFLFLDFCSKFLVVAISPLIVSTHARQRVDEFLDNVEMCKNERTWKSFFVFSFSFLRKPREKRQRSTIKSMSLQKVFR